MQTNTTMVGVRTREGRRISNATDLVHMHVSLHMNNQLFKLRQSKDSRNLSANVDGFFCFLPRIKYVMIRRIENQHRLGLRNFVY